MSRVKYAVLPAIAVVILVTVAASAASSVPEWFKGGSAIGESTLIGFTGKSIAGTPTLQSTVGNKVICESSTSKGEISGPRSIKNTKVTYHGCKEGTTACTSAGQAEGTIASFKLVGENVFLDSAHKKAGVVLKAATGTKFATFKCGSSEVQVTGNLMAEAGEIEHIEAFLVEAAVGGGSEFSSPLKEEDTFAQAVELHG
jgi:hypothetical protein